MVIERMRDMAASPFLLTGTLLEMGAPEYSVRSKAAAVVILAGEVIRGDLFENTGMVQEPTAVNSQPQEGEIDARR